MGYREVSRMEMEEVVRRLRAGESQRAIARATGMARNTVAKYVLAAFAAGLVEGEATPRVSPAGRRPGPAPGQGAEQIARLLPYQERVRHWLAADKLQLTRVQELLAQEGMAVSYTTLRRFVRKAGLGGQQRTTVRMAETAPGELAEMDFGQLGRLADPESGKRRLVWALVLVLPYSRHSFFWPLMEQTLAAVIEGLERAWRFFGGVSHRLVLDNFPAAVAGTDPLAPRPTRGFLEYSQARGFLVDPARVRRPQDKPHVERGIGYVRERFWKGGTFSDLGDVRAQAERWCREVAGQRIHGTTRRLPLVVFQDEEQAQLLPLADEPYDVPVWRTVTVHPDHHVAFGQALYSVPATRCPPGMKLEVRGDSALVRLYHRGELVKVHPHQSKGRRSTDPEDYPPERTAYALRAPDRLIRQAATIGEHVEQFARRLLDGPLPWAKLRQAQKLVRLAERYTPARLDAACGRALGFDLVDVRRLERILVLALEQESLPAPAVAGQLHLLLPGRFVRPGSAFDHRSGEAEP
jgi:transposase